jgi:predicted nucleotidyltransferase
MAVPASLDTVLAHLDVAAPGQPLGVYLYGSATSGGLRRDSDLDVLVVTRRSLDAGERDALVAVLLDASGPHPRRDPDAPRAIELTSIVLADAVPWRDPPRRDLQFGEWLRDDIEAGAPLAVQDDPDVPLLVATAQTSHVRLRGAALADLVPPVPREVVRRAMVASLDDILEEIVGDERNTLLVLARMLVTGRSGEIVPKDVAASRVAEERHGGDRLLLERARDGYLGLAEDVWSGTGSEVDALARRLATEIRQITGR